MKSGTDSVQLAGITATLAFTLCLGLVGFHCRSGNGPDGRTEVVSTPPTEPVYQPPSDTVVTLLSRISDDAPAASLDHVGFLKVAFLGGVSDQEVIQLPLGGAAMVVLREVVGPVEVEVTVYSPQAEPLSVNSLRSEQLSGAVGILAFEVSPSASGRGCIRCTNPVASNLLPGLHETYLYWSSHSSSPQRQDSDLHIAMRATSDLELARTCVSTAGGSILREGQANDGLVWWRIGPTPNTDPIALAIALSACSGVKGIEMYERGRSGSFWPVN